MALDEETTRAEAINVCGGYRLNIVASHTYADVLKISGMLNPPIVLIQLLRNFKKFFDVPRGQSALVSHHVYI